MAQAEGSRKNRGRRNTTGPTQEGANEKNEAAGTGTSRESGARRHDGGAALGHVLGGDVIATLPTTHEELSRVFVNQKIALFRQTGSATFIWEAYRLCRKWKIPIPDELFDYFDDCADAIASENSSHKVLARMKLRDVRGGAGHLVRQQSQARQLEQLDWLKLFYELLRDGGAGGLFSTKKQAREQAAEVLRERGHTDVTAESLRSLENRWHRKLKKM